MIARIGIISCIFQLIIVRPTFGVDGGSIKIGGGFGIKSYPVLLDPYEVVDRYPVVYPIVECDLRLIGSMYVTTNFSRHIIESNLFGCLCRQYTELNTTACGIDYNFGVSNRAFRTGIQLLVCFGKYDHGGYTHYSSTGSGVRLYAIATQPCTQFFSFGIRSNLQRLRIKPTPQQSTLNLDSFSVDLLVYISL